jgi:hypothetical protein
MLSPRRAFGSLVKPNLSDVVSAWPTIKTGMPFIHFSREEVKLLHVEYFKLLNKSLDFKGTPDEPQTYLLNVAQRKLEDHYLAMFPKETVSEESLENWFQSQIHPEGSLVSKLPLIAVGTPETVDFAGDEETYDGDTPEGQIIRAMNRNARRPKKANHGARPCSRISRRKKRYSKYKDKCRAD